MRQSSTRLALLFLCFPLFAQEATLDFAFFRDQVQPIFLNKRPGHARCVVCHDHGAPGLVPLEKGAATWTEEQSRKNFDAWSKFVSVRTPDNSILLLHPLATSAGGDHFHAGGKHFPSKDDPEWKILARWARGEKSLAKK